MVGQAERVKVKFLGSRDKFQLFEVFGIFIHGNGINAANRAGSKIVFIEEIYQPAPGPSEPYH